MPPAVPIGASRHVAGEPTLRNALTGASERQRRAVPRYPEVRVVVRGLQCRPQLRASELRPQMNHPQALYEHWRT